MTHSFHFMCISVLHVSFLCVVALCGQERVLDPLKLELQMAVSHHRGAGNPARSSLQEQQMFSTANLSFQPFCFECLTFTHVYVEKVLCMEVQMS